MPQLIALLGDAPSAECLDGEWRRKMSPRSRHARVQALLVMILERCGGTIGMAGTEWDFKLGLVDDSDTLLVPDVAFVSFERLAAVPAAEREELPIAPDVAIEVRSPGDGRAFREKKIRKFLACGTHLVLEVDPRKRTIAAHAPSGVRIYRVGERFEHQAAPWLAFAVTEAFIGLDLLEGNA